MAQRALIAITVLALVSGLSGCKKPRDEAQDDKGGGEPAAVEVKPVDVPAYLVSPEKGEHPVRADLRIMALNCRQLSALLDKERDLAFREIEAKGWLIAGKAGGMVGWYKHNNPTVKPADRPEFVRDLDLVAVNARRLALAAATWNAKAVRRDFANLDLAAKRCLPDLDVPVAPAVPVTETAPASKVPASKTPDAKTPATKTPATKTPATKTPATKTPDAKTPATKTAPSNSASGEDEK